MLLYFVFYDNLAVAPKNKNKKRRLLLNSFSIEWLENVLFRKEITVGLKLEI